MRINTNETIPKNNPLEAQKQQFTKFSEIFSFGHRNVQGIAIHPVTSEIWAHEHGPQGGDELNLIQSGKNYGWPVITYGVNYVIGTKIGEGTKKRYGTTNLYLDTLHWNVWTDVHKRKYIYKMG